MEKLIISSPRFKDGGLIPVEYTGHGIDKSPELILENLSRDAVSVAIIMNDMGHPIPAYNHWVIWNIPAMPEIPGSIPLDCFLDLPDTARKRDVLTAMRGHVLQQGVLTGHYR